MKDDEIYVAATYSLQPLGLVTQPIVNPLRTHIHLVFSYFPRFFQPVYWRYGSCVEEGMYLYNVYHKWGMGVHNFLTFYNWGDWGGYGSHNS